MGIMTRRIVLALRCSRQTNAQIWPAPHLSFLPLHGWAARWREATSYLIDTYNAFLHRRRWCGAISRWLYSMSNPDTSPPTGPRSTDKPLAVATAPLICRFSHLRAFDLRQAAQGLGCFSGKRRIDTGCENTALVKYHCTGASCPGSQIPTAPTCQAVRLPEPHGSAK